MNHFPIITVVTMTPLVGAAALIALDAANRRVARLVALGFSLLALAGRWEIGCIFDASSGAQQMTERWDWIPSLNAEYFVGVDGLGLVMVLLTAIVAWYMAILAALGQ